MELLKRVGEKILRDSRGNFCTHSGTKVITERSVFQNELSPSKTPDLLYCSAYVHCGWRPRLFVGMAEVEVSHRSAGPVVTLFILKRLD